MDTAQSPRQVVVTAIIALAAEKLQISAADIIPDSSLSEDLGMDSAHIVELLIKFEETQKVEMDLSDLQAADMVTVNSLINYLMRTMR